MRGIKGTWPTHALRALFLNNAIALGDVIVVRPRRMGPLDFAVLGPNQRDLLDGLAGRASIIRTSNGFSLNVASSPPFNASISRRWSLNGLTSV